MICFLAVITDRADIQHIILDQGQQKAKYWKLKHDCREGHLNCLNYPKKMMNTRLFWSPVFFGSQELQKKWVRKLQYFRHPQFPFYKTVCQIPTIDYCWASYPVPFHVYPCFVDALLSSKIVARLEKASVCSWCIDKYWQWFWSGFLANHLYPGSWPFQLPCFFLKLLFTVVDSRIFVCGVFVCGG